MKGIYCLIIKVEKDITLQIGASRIIDFKKGLYAYIGSAQNNLQKRIQRHLSRNKKIRWHIDYLLSSSYVMVKKVLYKEAGKDEECNTADSLAKREEGIRGFGCSDCRCFSHLFRLKSLKSTEGLRWNLF